MAFFIPSLMSGL